MPLTQNMINKSIPTDRDLVLRRYDEARSHIHENVWKLEAFRAPVIVCGKEYPGKWLEHNLDDVGYYDFDPQVAMDGHRLFVEMQTAEGMLPTFVARPGWAACKTALGTCQVQSLVPLATSALILFRRSGDRRFLEEVCLACERYDAWLMKYRNTLGTGLLEMFCEFDTGHDKSPRVRDGGLPHSCPDFDARKCPDNPILPIVSCDLSAMLYGARTSLAEMASLLGRPEEAAQWREKADRTRARLIEYCFDEEDCFFYDVDRRGEKRKYHSEHITRIFMNKVCDQTRFDAIYERWFADTKAFATPYPIASMALSDPSFDHSFPPNSWACWSQALTAQRTSLWMEEYGRSTDYERLMLAWIDAISRSPRRFTQEIHPVTGEMSECAEYYTPTMLIYMDFVQRLFL